jgi:hypothetical protein
VTLATGTRLGAYEILSLIGSGGADQVYRATHTKLAPKALPNEWCLIAHDRKRRDVWAKARHASSERRCQTPV